MVLGQMGISKAVLKYSIEIDTQIDYYEYHYGVITYLSQMEARHKHGDYEGMEDMPSGDLIPLAPSPPFLFVFLIPTLPSFLRQSIPQVKTERTTKDEFNISPSICCPPHTQPPYNSISLFPRHVSHAQIEESYTFRGIISFFFFFITTPPWLLYLLTYYFHHPTHYPIH